MPFNNTAKDAMLNALDEATTVDFIGIHTLVDPGTGTNAAAGEASGGGYARQGVTWGAASSGLKSNTNALTFDLAAGTYGFFDLFDVVSGNTNNFYGFLPFGGNVLGVGSVDAAGLTSESITSAAHGLIDDNRVMVSNVYAESLPGGLTEGVIYFVVSATTDTFKVSLTSGGGAVNITSVGELFFQRVVPQVLSSAGQITVAIGALVMGNQGF